MTVKTPPKQKRTFDLNGEQLPCPIHRSSEHQLNLFGSIFFFESSEDKYKVAKALLKLLCYVRDKD